MENTVEVEKLAERLQRFFADQDRADEFKYLPWERLSESQKSWWRQCSNYALNGDAHVS